MIVFKIIIYVGVKLLKKIKFLSFLTAFLLLSASTNTSHAEGDLDIASPSAVLIEQNTGKVLFEKNSKEVRFGTSVMKIMPILLALEAIDAGKISENDKVNTSNNAATAQGADVWLKPGESITVCDLIKSISLVSANDASIALAERMAGSEGAFVSDMNARAKELGMENTIFKNCVGNDEDGNVTTAYDVALMSRELMKHKNIIQYTTTWIDHIRNGQTQIVNTNKMIKFYQGITGLKTGTSPEAGSCISATANRNGVRLIAVTLGCESTAGRYKDAASLLDYGFASYTTITPILPEDMPKTVKVTNGIQNEVPITADITGNIIVPKGSEQNISYEITLNENITAPIEENYKIGKLICKLGNETLCEYDIIITSNVLELEFTLIFKNLLINFLSL